MSTVLSSISEITRVGGWALRGAGYPFGVAERGGHLMARAEAVCGKAIQSLRLSETAIGASHLADPCRHVGNPGSGRTVQARGRHLLEIGPPAIDLVTHDARHEQAGHVRVEDVFGLAFLPALASLMAHRKLSAVFSYCAAEGDLLPDGFSAAGWLVVGNGSGGAGFVHGGLEGEAGNAVRRALARAEGISAGLLDRTLEDIDMAAAAQPGRMGVLALSNAHSPAGSLLDLVRPLAQGVRFVDFSKRFADALTNGVPIEGEVLAYLYDLEIRTWAPTSERSRSQAGYGAY